MNSEFADIGIASDTQIIVQFDEDKQSHANYYVSTVTRVIQQRTNRQ